MLLIARKNALSVGLMLVAFNSKPLKFNSATMANKFEIFDDFAASFLECIKLLPGADVLFCAFRPGQRREQKQQKPNRKQLVQKTNAHGNHFPFGCSSFRMLFKPRLVQEFMHFQMSMRRQGQWNIFQYLHRAPSSPKAISFCRFIKKMILNEERKGWWARNDEHERRWFKTKFGCVILPPVDGVRNLWECVSESEPAFSNLGQHARLWHDANGLLAVNWHLFQPLIAKSCQFVPVCRDRTFRRVRF